MKNEIIKKIIFLIYVIYAGSYIWQTSLTVNGQRVFTLHDDMMCSMRYALNAVAGRGLVFNIGEKVQGFSNPIWTFYMMIPHILRIPITHTSLFLQITGLLLMLGVMHFVGKITDYLIDNRWFGIAAMIFTGFCYALNTWSLQGFEVSLITFLMVLEMYLRLKEHPRIWRYLTYVALLLIRLDLVALVIIYAIADTITSRKFYKIGLAFIILAIAGQLLFSRLYYGGWLSNTYYLKMTGIPLGWRVWSGFTAFIKFVMMTGLPILAVTIVFCRRYKYLWIPIIIQCLYSIWVGGDCWERLGANRFIAITMPFYFVLVATALSQLIARPSRLAITLITVACLFSFNLTDGLNSTRQFLLIDKPFSRDINANIYNSIPAYARVTTRNAKYGATMIGILGYFSDHYIIDFLGKIDQHIARSDIHINRSYLPGHCKYDLDYSFGQRPDIVTHSSNLLPWRTDSFLAADYVKLNVMDVSVFVRRDSPNLRVIFKK